MQTNTHVGQRLFEKCAFDFISEIVYNEKSICKGTEGMYENQ